MSQGHDGYGDLRSVVREVLADFPASYWRDLDQVRAYPEAFVQAMTEKEMASIQAPA